ncbi:MAG: DUF3105 domain-containing protein [bacterium]|nr:DUF3105 domain-containing protein [bacterium]
MSNKELTKTERREQRRKKQVEESRAQEKEQTKKVMMKWSIITIILIGALALIVLILKNSGGEDLGERIPDLGRDHVKLGEEHAEYNSIPATSGPHADEAKWGVHNEPVPYENQLHNMEHGGVVIHYHPDKIENLDALTSYFQELQDGKSKLMLVPDEKLETVYAMTAWTKLYTFDEYNEENIKRFVKKNYNRAPERTPEQ